MQLREDEERPRKACPHDGWLSLRLGKHQAKDQRSSAWLADPTGMRCGLGGFCFIIINAPLRVPEL
eukprot:scaffold520381_cov22-Prasinocladus_malaysianus.AAC.1